MNSDSFKRNRVDILGLFLAVIVSSVVMIENAMASSLEEWESSGLEVTAIQEFIMPASQTRANFDLSFNLVIFEKSGWTQTRIWREILRTSAVFSSCRVHLKSVNLILAKSPTGSPDLKDPVSGEYAHDPLSYTYGQPAPKGTTAFVAEKIPLSTKELPTVFLLRKYLGGLSYLPSAERIWGPALAGTAWIGVDSDKKKKLQKNHPEWEPQYFSIIAHELAHLMDLHHDFQSQGNVLSYPYSKYQPKFDPEQCAKVSKSAYLVEAP